MLRNNLMNNSTPTQFEHDTFKLVARRLIPFLFVCYIVAFLDRVNVGFAKLQMATDLHLSDSVYGFGAGIFFIGYFIFEVPSNIILEKVGARKWIARIMITWGVISSAFVFTNSIAWGAIARAFNCTDAEFTFYLLRFLLGVSEAGFFPGVILYLTYWFPSSRRAKMTALFMTAVAIANVVGAPVSGAIMQYMHNFNGLRGWQWLFLLEGLPSIIMGVMVLLLLDNGPANAKWLTPQQRDTLAQRLHEDNQHKQGGGHNFISAFQDGRVWALAMAYFCAMVGFYAVNFWMPTMIQELGVDSADFLKVGLLSMIPWGVAAVVMVVVGSHGDRTGERRWHAASGMFVSAVGMIMLAIAGKQPIYGMIGLTLITSGTLTFMCTFWSLPTAFLSGTAAAAGIAWINSVGNLGGHFGPDMIGRIRESTNSSAVAFVVLAGLAVVGGAIVLLLPKAKQA